MSNIAATLRKELFRTRKADDDYDAPAGPFARREELMAAKLREEIGRNNAAVMATSALRSPDGTFAYTNTADVFVISRHLDASYMPTSQVVTHLRCSHCGSKWIETEKGNCMSCGAPE